MPENYSSRIRLLPAGVKRLTEDSVEVRWNPKVRRLETSIYRGDSPDTILLDSPLARVKNENSVTLSGLPADRHHFFKLIAEDGTELIIGEGRPVVEGCPNLRDLGGYETTDGRLVKWGRIFRSSNLGRLTSSLGKWAGTQSTITPIPALCSACTRYWKSSGVPL